MAYLIEKTVTSYFHVKDVGKFKRAMEVFEKRVSYEEDAGRLRLSIHTGGWGVFNDKEIQRIDTAAVFASDAEAVEFVKRQADAGSEFHKAVLEVRIKS